MKIWVLGIASGHNTDIYDCYNGYVIVAETEAEARALANDRPGDEGSIWEDPSKVDCDCIGHTIGNDKTAHVIMASFHAG